MKNNFSRKMIKRVSDIEGKAVVSFSFVLLSTSGKIIPLASFRTANKTTLAVLRCVV